MESTAEAPVAGMLNTKLKHTNNTMDTAFQDGGAPNVPNTLDRTGNHEFMDGSQGNAEPSSFSQALGGPSDTYGKMSDGGTGFNSAGFGRGAFNTGSMSDQHGGLNTSTATSGSGPGDFSGTQNSQFPPYGHQSMRPGFTGSSRPGAMAGRAPLGGPNLNIMSQNYSGAPGAGGTGQPRLMSGASIQQQGGPTPTLNQLLQNSSTSRYPPTGGGGGYSDYSMGQQKGSPDTPNSSSGYNNTTQNWGPGGPQRPMGPYQQHMSSNQPYRNQGQMYDPSGRRPGGLGQAYPSSSGTGSQFMGPGQFSPNSQRFPAPVQGPRPMHQQPYGQQMPPQYGQPGGPVMMNNQQNQQSFTSQHQLSPQSHPQSQQSPQPATPNQQKGPPSQTSSQSSSSPNSGHVPSIQSPGHPGQSQASPSTQQKQPQDPIPSSPVNNQPHPSPQDAAHTPSSTNSNPEDTSGEVNTSTSQSSSHAGLSSLRPAPSPAGSTGSRSNTPASLTGNQAGSPMPPRPPSTHIEGNTRIQSPLTGQGVYPQNRLGMPGYAGPGNYGSTNMMGGNQMYNTNSPGSGPGPGGMGSMNRTMPNSSYPNSYSPQQSGGPMNVMNNQYGNFNSQGGVSSGSGTAPPNQNMPASMPSGSGGGINSYMNSNVGSHPSQGTNLQQGPHGPKGAQAAAQAAMIAAANTAGRGGFSRHGSSGQTSPGPGGPSPGPGPGPGLGTGPGSGSVSGPGVMGPHGPARNHGHFPNPQMNQMSYNSMNMTPGSGSHGSVDGMMGGTPLGSMTGYNSSSMNMNSIPPNQEIGSSHPSIASNSSSMLPNNVVPSNMGHTAGTHSEMVSSTSTSTGSSSQPGSTISPSNCVPSSMGGVSSSYNSSLDSAITTVVSSVKTLPSSASTEGSITTAPEGDSKNQVSMANSTAGGSGTIVTQSITGPVTNSVEDSNTPTPPTTSSPPGLQSQFSQSSDSSQPSFPPPQKPPTPSQENSNSNSGFPQLEDPHLEKLRKDNTSHPPTPVAPSPSASMSSVHDEFENISSPSWPGTPSQKAVGNDTISRLSEMGDEPDRRMFLDKLFGFMEERGAPITAMPCISKQPIDLFRLYVMVKERGGLLEVTKAKKWRDICSALNCGSSGSAGFTLRKNYIKLLFNFECKFDRGGIDPMPVLAQIEAMSDKKTKKSSNQQNNQQGPPVDPFRAPNNQGYEGFSPGQHPGGQRPFMGTPEMPAPPNQMLPPNTNMMNNLPYPDSGNMMNNMPPNTSMSTTGQMMSSNNMPNNMGMPNSSVPNSGMGNNMNNVGIPNNSMPSSMGMPSSSMSGGQMISRNNIPPTGQESINVQDPFADEANMSGPGYQQRSGINSQMPPYSSNMQNSMSNTFPSYNRAGNMSSCAPTGSNFQGMNQQAQQSEQFDPYRRNMAGPETYPNRSVNQGQTPPSSSQDSFSSSNNQFGANRPMSSSNNSQFPFNSQFDSSQSGNQMVGSQQPMRPPSQPGMNQGSHPEGNAMYPRPYVASPQQMPRPSTPQDQYPPQQGYPGGSPTQVGTPPNQGYTAPRSFTQGQEQYSHQPSNQASGQSMYHTPKQPSVFGQKRFSDGFSMTSELRGGPSSWSPKYSSTGNLGYSANSSVNPNVPQSPYFNRGPQPPRMSPQHRPQTEKAGYSSPQKLPKPIPQAFSQKKEIVFPTDSVEAVQPLLNKRRKYTAKDLSPIEAWRLMMSLKSGLLSESTWALDTLSILLFDDSTITYFHLQHLPGLVEVLLSHWRQCLTQIFGGHDELEITADKRIALHQKLEKDAMLRSSKQDLEDNSLAALFARHRTDLESLEQPGNFTLISRKGNQVKIEEGSQDTDIIFDDKHWDVFSDFVSHARDFDHGKGDITDHVLTHFTCHGSQEFYRKKFFSQKYAEIKTYCKKVHSERSPVYSDNIRHEEKNCEDVENPEKNKTLIKAEGEVHSLSESYSNDVQVYKLNHMESETPRAGTDECISASLMNDNNTVLNIGCHSNSVCPSSSLLPPVNVKTEPVDTNIDKLIHTSGENVKGETGIESDNETQPNVKEEGFKVSEQSSYKPDCDDGSKQWSDPFLTEKEQDSGVVALESLKRKWADLEEGEAYQHDHPPLLLISEAQEELSRRCVCISNIFRSLSFVPGNELELSKHRGLLMVLGHLLMLHHTHPPHHHNKQRRFDHEDVDAGSGSEDDPVEEQRREWWWDTIEALRENTLVILANIAGQLNLAHVPEHICLPLLDGLLHWAVCPAACAHDPMTSMSTGSVLSAQRLVLETLCKLCVQEENVDLLLATPPFSRVVHLLIGLVKLLADRKEQVLREFAIVLLSSLVAGESSAARAVALHHPAITLLLDFLETAEGQAMQIANSHGVDMLRENPEMMGTSLDMLRRAAYTLAHLAAVPDNRSLFLHLQPRLLTLVMSQILDQNVAAILADVLYQCSQDQNTGAPS